MILEELSAIEDGDLPLAQFKDHLRLGTGFDDDSLQDAVLHSFLRAALSAIEARIGKIILQRSFQLILNAWRDDEKQILPIAPVQSVDLIRVITANGDETDISPDAYQLKTDTHFPYVSPVGTCLPTLADGAVAWVEFTAGFDPSWDNIPADLAQAVFLLAAHYYEFRHETALGDGCMPFGVTALLERYKPLRLGRGVN